jgi:hypothetical protein
VELFFHILSQSTVHCRCIERLLIFMLIFCPVTLLKLFMVSRSFLGLLGIRSCHLKIGIV